MKWDSIVFDLDGTLWDTSTACATAWNGVLETEQIEFRPITEQDVRAVTGKPHPVAIEEAFAGLSPDEIARIAKATEAADSRVISRDGGTLYPGVAEGIPRLAHHFRLVIASNCQTGYIETFLQLSGLDDYFEDFESFGNTGKHKGENVRSLIQRNRLQSPIMIGDASGDEAAARHCAIPYVYVTYGFGSPMAPDYRFDRFLDLETFLLSSA